MPGDIMPVDKVPIEKMPVTSLIPDDKMPARQNDIKLTSYGILVIVL